MKKTKLDQTLRQITVEATCAPYMLRQSETVISSALTTTAKKLTVTNDRKPAIPRIKVTAATTVEYNGGSFTLNAGEHTLLDIEFPAGTSTLNVKTVSGTGNITITYQEGSL